MWFTGCLRIKDLDKTEYIKQRNILAQKTSALILKVVAFEALEKELQAGTDSGSIKYTDAVDQINAFIHGVADGEASSLDRKYQEFTAQQPIVQTQIEGLEKLQQQLQASRLIAMADAMPGLSH